jgi:hypothetical protein
MLHGGSCEASRRTREFRDTGFGRARRGRGERPGGILDSESAATSPSNRGGDGSMAKKKGGKKKGTKKKAAKKKK